MKDHLSEFQNFKLGKFSAIDQRLKISHSKIKTKVDSEMNDPIAEFLAPDVEPQAEPNVLEASAPAVEPKPVISAPDGQEKEDGTLLLSL